MLKLAKLAAFALLSALAASSYADSSKAAAVVNGVAIPQSRLDMRVDAATKQGQADTPELRKAIREDLVNLELLSQEASKKGLDKQSDTAQQLELVRQSALAGAYVQDYFKNHPINDDTLKAEYESLKSKLGKTEYKAAHILVQSEDEAKAIEAQLKKGAKFDKLAKDKSKDAGSAERGGDLGWNVPSNFVPEFSNAMTSLKKGQVSAPVHSQFGWHVIKLEDVRDLSVPPFEQVKPNLMQRMQGQEVQKAIAELRAKAKID